jgi:hypothetical protein
VAARHARANFRSGLSPSAASTTRSLALSLSGAGRSTRAFARVASAATASASAPGSAGRAEIASSTGSSSTRTPRYDRKRSDGGSAQWESSTAKNSGRRSARFTVSQ